MNEMADMVTYLTSGPHLFVGICVGVVVIGMS